MIVGPETLTETKANIRDYIKRTGTGWIHENVERGFFAFQSPATRGVHLTQDSMVVNLEMKLAMVGDGLTVKNGVSQIDINRIFDLLPGERAEHYGYADKRICFSGAGNTNEVSVLNPGGYASYKLVDYIQSQMQSNNDLVEQDPASTIREIIRSYPQFLFNSVWQQLYVLNSHNIDWSDDCESWGKFKNSRGVDNDYPRIAFLSNVAGMFQINDKVYTFAVGDATVMVKNPSDSAAMLTTGISDGNKSDSVGVILQNSDDEGWKGYLVRPQEEEIVVNEYDLKNVENLFIETDGFKLLPFSYESYDDASAIYVSDPKKFFDVR